MFLPSQGKSIAPTVVYLSSTIEKPLRRDRCRWSTEMTLSQLRQNRKPLLVLCCMCSSYLYGILEVAQRGTYLSISTSDLKSLAEKAPHHVQLGETCVQNSLGRVWMHPSLPWPCLQHYHKAPSAPSHAFYLQYSRLLQASVGKTKETYMYISKLLLNCSLNHTIDSR